MSSRANRSHLATWGEVNRGLNLLAHALDVPQSATEAQFNAVLDELARGPLPEIPTADEALVWAEEAAL